MANGHITVLNNSLDVWKVALYVFLKHVQSKMSKSILTCSNAFQWNFFFIFCNSAIESWCFWQICYCTILLARYFLEVLEKKETLSSSDESELEFSSSSLAEPSRAGALQISSWNRKNVIQIFQFCACTIMITTNSYQFHCHLYKSM